MYCRENLLGRCTPACRRDCEGWWGPLQSFQIYQPLQAATEKLDARDGGVKMAKEKTAERIINFSFQTFFSVRCSSSSRRTSSAAHHRTDARTKKNIKLVVYIFMCVCTCSVRGTFIYLFYIFLTAVWRKKKPDVG